MTGFLITRGGSRLIPDFGGVQKVAPVLAGIFLVGGLSSLSLPGLSPFVSEFLVMTGAFVHNWWYAAFAVLGIVHRRALHPADVPTHDDRAAAAAASRGSRTSASARSPRWRRCWCSSSGSGCSRSR